MRHAPNVGDPDPAAMLLSVAKGSAALGRRVAWRLQTSAPKSATSRGPSGRIDRPLHSFPEPIAFLDGAHHVADTGRNACHFSCCSHIHAGGRPVCRLVCSSDRPEPSASRALRAHLLAPVLIAIQPKRWTSGIVVPSLKERLGGRFSLEGKRLCHARGASLCQDRQHVIVESVERLPQMEACAARRGFAGISRFRAHIKVVSSLQSLIR
jgi:hypothetical protein